MTTMTDKPAQGQRKRPGPTGDPRVFEWVKVRDLIVDQRKQRECDPEKVAKIANEFDWRRFEALTVARTNDDLYVVVEGQHRALAVRTMGEDLLVPCMVLPGKVDGKVQAQIALDIVQGRRGHSAYETWRLCYNAGHAHEVYATVALDTLGLRVGKGPSAMTIGAVATVRRIVHGGNFSPEFGAELLHRVLKTILVAYPTHDHQSNVSRWDRYIMLAVSTIYLRWPEAEDKRVAQSLQVRPAVQWVNLGKGAEGPTADEVIVAQVANEYNRNRKRGRLG